MKGQKYAKNIRKESGSLTWNGYLTKAKLMQQQTWNLKKTWE